MTSELNIAFWNLAGNGDADRVASLTHEGHAHLVILAEPSGLDIERLQLRLEAEYTAQYSFPSQQQSRKRLFVLVREPLVAAVVFEERHMLVLRVAAEFGEFLCAALHLRSGLYEREGDAFEKLFRASNLLIRVEREQRLDRTMVIGDFNADPYSAGMVNFRALNSVMDRRIAASGTRTYQGDERPYFYNPMWSLLGDREERPAASYFDRGASGHVEPRYWHMFDQVLVRPSLLEHLPAHPVRLVTRVGETDCVDERSRPRRSVSDHLPLLVSLTAPGAP